MLILSTVIVFVVLGGLVGGLFLIWRTDGQKMKLPKHEEMHLSLSLPFVVSVVLLLTYVAAGHGSWLYGLEIGFSDLLLISATGLPFLFVFLSLLHVLHVGLINRDVRKRKEQRD